MDLAWTDVKLGVEVQGGIYSSKGGHSSVKGILRDMEKSNLAVREGWALLQFESNYSMKPETADFIQDVYNKLKGEKDEP